MPGAYVAVPGAHLWYLDTGGAGPPVVFLHANTGTSASWSNPWADQLGFFSRAGYRAIAFDRRGWGRSMADPSTGDQPGSIAEDLESLLRALGLASISLVGVAGGAFAAIDYAHWRPRRVRCLVAAASMAMITEGEIGEFSATIRIPALQAPGSPPALLEVSAGYRGACPDGTEHWSGIEASARQPGAPKQPLRTPNTYAKLAEITAPVLVLAGDADLIAPPKLMKLWAAKLRDHQFATISGAGHSVAFEEPEQFNRAVLDFLSKQDG